MLEEAMRSENLPPEESQKNL